jgi:hypothetical protein
MLLHEDDIGEDSTPWFNTIEPKAEESIASFLIRFRNAEANRISSATRLGEIVGADTPIHCWEKLFFSKRPKQEQLEALSRITRVEVDRLRAMFPAEDKKSRPAPIRICAACCEEESYHRIVWQYTPIQKCEHHKIALLIKCPNCEQSFSISELLGEAKGCRKCGMRFSSMAKNRGYVSC